MEGHDGCGCHDDPRCSRSSGCSCKPHAQVIVTKMDNNSPVLRRAAWTFALTRSGQLLGDRERPKCFGVGGWGQKPKWPEVAPITEGTGHRRKLNWYRRKSAGGVVISVLCRGHNPLSAGGGVHYWALHFGNTSVETLVCWSRIGFMQTRLARRGLIRWHELEAVRRLRRYRSHWQTDTGTQTPHKATKRTTVSSRAPSIHTPAGREY